MAQKALLIVDVQNDFCPGGALGVTDGDKIIEPINDMIGYAIDNGWRIIASRDWHPKKTVHFDKWPAHCVQDTPGAEFHPRLRLLRDVRNASVVSKGMNDQDDGYSLFEGVRLTENHVWDLSSNALLVDCDTVYVCGLATDYCVKATALDAAKRGFKTYLLLDACRAVNVNPGDGQKAIEEMQRAGVVIISVAEVLHGNVY